MVIEEVMNLTESQKDTVRGLIVFLHSLGVSDEDMKNLPEVLKNWPVIKKNIEFFGAKTQEFGERISKLEQPDYTDKDGLPTIENIQKSTGFASIFGGNEK